MRNLLRPRLVEPANSSCLRLHWRHASPLRFERGRQVAVDTSLRRLPKRRLLATERRLVACRLGLHW